jgi:hypothetical protein
LNRSPQALNQIFAHAAAEATILQLQNLLVGADDQLVVDTHFAELVNDDGAMVTVVLA